MRDTLDHLVSATINRSDSGKFLYILNQIDTTAREDNPEEVVAAWQRAMGERGLTAGRFFTIYNQEAASPIDDPALRARFEGKRDRDLADIHERMQQVEVERAYRIVAALEKTARSMSEKVAPALGGIIEKWRKRTLVGDAVLAILLLGAFLAMSIQGGHWDGLSYQAGWWQWVTQSPLHAWGSALAAYVIWLGIHYGVRHLAAKTLKGYARKLGKELDIRGDLAAAFQANTRPWRSIFSRKPAGWGRRSQRRVQQVIEDVDRYVQNLNDNFTNPSGHTFDAPRTDAAALFDSVTADVEPSTAPEIEKAG